MERRTFLKSLAVLTAAGAWGNFSTVLAKEKVSRNKDLIAIFSDMHLRGPEDIQQAVRFKLCVDKILAMNPRPATLLIFGDMAFSEGNVEEYTLFRKLIKPIEKAGIRWECVMGNHDRIDSFRRIFPKRFSGKPILKNRYIHIVKTPRADFILLDSYWKDHVEGMIEPDQKAWLAETLKKGDKPVFVGSHHPLCETGLAQTLAECPRCAAYLHGHSHYWLNRMEETIQTICFPTTGHWGDLGFVLLTLSDGEALFQPQLDGYQCPAWSQDKPSDMQGYLQERNNNPVKVRLFTS